MNLQSLRFERDELSPSAASASLSESFVLFVVEVLQERYPQISAFPEGGKDGAIDFVAETAYGRMFGEAKIVGSDEVTDVVARWSEVARRLERNLADGAGPPLGQPQYRPWYRSDLKEYVFCISAELRRLEARQRLETHIRTCFERLARTHEHLAHLGSVDVSVYDWRDLATRATALTAFRWFRRMRPPSLSPLVEASNAPTFRSYLQSDQLPYYSIRLHLHAYASPAGVAVEDEEQLVSRLGSDDNFGIVIAGAGGFGKTRLAREVGLVAQRQGWLVVEAGLSCTTDDIDEFAAALKPQDKALILFDYVETRSSFAALVDQVADANRSLDLTIRYVANCRPSYVPRVAAIPSQHIVDLSPLEASASAWRRSFREAAVSHILQANELDDPRLTQVARDQPILAVFFAYLQASGRRQDLDELLGLGDFGVWVARRVELSFREPGVARELAVFCTMFPLVSVAVTRLPPEPFGPLLDRLAADGWVEPSDEADGMWRAIHDVLIDQIVAAYLAEVPRTAEQFFQHALTVAVACGSTVSSLLAFQRLADLAPAKLVRWRQVFAPLIDELAADRDASVSLLRTPLLTIDEVVELLRLRPESWAGVTGFSGGRLALASVAQRALSEPPSDGTAAGTLSDWIESSLRGDEHDTRLLAAGIRLAPSRFRATAGSWLHAHQPPPWHASLLLVAWLEAGQDPEDIADYVSLWLRGYGRTTGATFLYRAWLKHARDIRVVRGPIESWLATKRTIRAAQYVYAAWLRAGGDLALVREPIRRWLELHAQEREAQFVYKAWLDAKGERDLVHHPIREWLATYADAPEAQFVYKAWLDAGGEIDLVRMPMATWLDTHHTMPEARFVYEAWLGRGGEPGFIRESLQRWLVKHRDESPAGFVYTAWLKRGGGIVCVSPPMQSWLQQHATLLESRHVFTAWLRGGGDPDVVSELVAAWLDEHRATPGARDVCMAWLGATGNTSVVREHILAWLNGHRDRVEARSLFRAWLRAGGPPEIIQKDVGAWLAQHQTTIEARSLYHDWLNWGGDREDVRESLRAWLRYHEIRRDAKLVYTAWIVAGGQLNVIEDPIAAWFEHNRKGDALALARLWLRHGGSAGVVPPALDAGPTSPPMSS